MNKSMKKLACLALLALSSASYANGEIDFVSGGVTVTNDKGELRIPLKGQRVEPGDTVSTGRDGEVHLLMDDSGLIALRPSTRLKIEVYSANGNADDSVVLNLFRGTFRSITGWVGKSNPTRYAIRTPSATIGIRGTDHEPLVIDEGPDAGTYDKVNSGGTSLSTALGNVNVGPQQAGFVPRGQPVAPKVLPAIPAIYKPSANEGAIETRKTSLEKGLDQKLKERRQENERNGAGPAIPLSTAQGSVKLGTAEDGRRASIALDELLAAYEQGNVGFLRSRLNPSMIGLQKLLDDVTRETNICKQMRILLLDKQVQAGPDLVVVQTNFQKRCLQLPNLVPVFSSGHTTFLMHREAGGWTMAAVSGNSPFTSVVSAGGVGTLVVNSGASFAATLAGGPASPQPFLITVTDADRAGQASVPVRVTTSGPGGNDFLIVNLPAAGAGSPKFSVATLPFARALACGGLPGPQPSVLEICSGTTYTVTYADPTTPNGPQTVIARGLIP